MHYTLRGALAVAAASAAAMGQAQPVASAGIYEICVNGSCSEPVSVATHDGLHWIDAAAFNELDIAYADWAQRELDGVPHVAPLSRFPHARVELEASSMQLRLTLPAEAWPERRYSALRQRPQVTPEARRSAYLDYSLAARTGAAPVLYGEWGVVQGPWLLRSSLEVGEKAYRGLSSLEFEDIQRLRRWTVGDQFVSSGDVFGAAAIVGGFGVASALEIDPGLLRYPGADIHGSMSAPGSIEVYANGQLVTREEVSAGPFRIEDLALTQGRSDLRVIVHDPFVGTYEVSDSYYGYSRLLAPGLHDYAYRLGRVRPHALARRYEEQTLLSAYHRYGFKNWLSAGIRAEQLGRRANAGISVDARLPVGGLSVAIARSDDDNGVSGWAERADFHYQSRYFAGGLGWQRQDIEYAPLQQPGLRSAQDRPLASRHANVSLPLWRGASISGNRSWLDFRDGGRSRRSNLRFSTPLGGRLTLHIEGGQHRPQTGPDETFWLASLLLPMKAAGMGLNASMRNRQSADIAATAYRAREEQSRGWSYRGEAGRVDGHPYGQGDVEWAIPQGNLRVSARHRDDATQGDARFSGSLLLAGGDLHPVTTGTNGYALVTTSGAADVPILRENRYVGRTDGEGKLLVADLFPYQPNLLTVDGRQLDIALQVDQGERYIGVRRHGVAYVDFKVRTSTSAQARLVTADGGSLRFGRAWLAGAAESSATRIGNDGEIYLEAVHAGTHRVHAVTEAGERYQCELDVPEAASMAWLGETTCRRE